MFILPGCKDIGIWKLKFVAKIQFLSDNLVQPIGLIHRKDAYPVQPF